MPGLSNRPPKKPPYLLKNDAAVLPLKAADLDSVVLIGPTAGQVDAIGIAGERSLGLPERRIGPLDALKALARNNRVRYAVDDDMTGTPIPPNSSVTPGAAASNGRTGESIRR